MVLCCQQRCCVVNGKCFHDQDKCRNRLTDAIRRQKGTKSLKTTELIGCSYEYLMDHIESYFPRWPGMSWDNMDKWHVDHIVPCKQYNLKDEAQQRLCFHWSNLQPLWAVDNLKKGSKRDWQASDLTNVSANKQPRV